MIMRREAFMCRFADMVDVETLLQHPVNELVLQTVVRAVRTDPLVESNISYSYRYKCMTYMLVLIHKYLVIS